MELPIILFYIWYVLQSVSSYSEHVWLTDNLFSILSKVLTYRQVACGLDATIGHTNRQVKCLNNYFFQVIETVDGKIWNLYLSGRNIL
jgi:hypothetical protein